MWAAWAIVFVAKISIIRKLQVSHKVKFSHVRFDGDAEGWT